MHDVLVISCAFWLQSFKEKVRKSIHKQQRHYATSRSSVWSRLMKSKFDSVSVLPDWSINRGLGYFFSWVENFLNLRVAIFLGRLLLKLLCGTNGRTD